MKVKVEKDIDRTYLHSAKDELGMTWDAFAEAAGIDPRALKNYRMPDNSGNKRPLPELGRRSIEQLLTEHRKKNRKKSA